MGLEIGFWVRNGRIRGYRREGGIYMNNESIM